jgi:hypothetical protein
MVLIVIELGIGCPVWSLRSLGIKTPIPLRISIKARSIFR